MKNLLFTALCLLFAGGQPVNSQNDNLVLNPGFEQLQPGSRFPVCSYTPSNLVFDKTLAEWSTFAGMTPDLIIWEADQYGDCRFPLPRSGKHALGLITYLPGTDLGRNEDFHELVQGKLRFPLQPGQPYRVSFFIQQSDSMAIDHLRTLYGEKQDVRPTAAGNFGIWFLYNPLRYLPKHDAEPQILFKEPITTQHGEWLEISAVFVPDRPFLYFAVGNFFRDKDTPTTLADGDEIEQHNLATTGFAEKKKRVAYYLIDDFSVMPVEIKKLPPVTANTIANDLKSKKTYTFKNVHFETGKWDLLPASIPELDALAAFLTQNPSVKMEIGGHTDNVGSESDNLVLSENRAAAVRNYLIDKGIGEQRLTFKGYGESLPVATNDTQEGRQQNRRVECKITAQ